MLHVEGIGKVTCGSQRNQEWNALDGVKRKKHAGMVESPVVRDGVILVL
jgi:hypothetical protein